MASLSSCSSTRGSASASEIVAGALQDHRTCRDHGRKDVRQGFGTDDSAAGQRLGSEAHHRTVLHAVGGTSIQARGIVPDIALDRVEVSRVDAGQGVTESDLVRHLENEGEGDDPGDAAQTPKEAGEPARPGDVPLAQLDFALYEALNLLKGLHILKSPS